MWLLREVCTFGCRMPTSSVTSCQKLHQKLKLRNISATMAIGLWHHIVVTLELWCTACKQFCQVYRNNVIPRCFSETDIRRIATACWCNWRRREAATQQIDAELLREISGEDGRTRQLDHDDGHLMLRLLISFGCWLFLIALTDFDFVISRGRRGPSTRLGFSQCRDALDYQTWRLISLPDSGASRSSRRHEHRLETFSLEITHTTLFAIKGSNNKKQTKQRKRSEINHCKITAPSRENPSCGSVKIRTQSCVSDRVRSTG